MNYYWIIIFQWFNNTMYMTKLEEVQEEYIKLLILQIAQLSSMSKIKLEPDVVEVIQDYQNKITYLKLMYSQI